MNRSDAEKLLDDARNKRADMLNAKDERSYRNAYALCEAAENKLLAALTTEPEQPKKSVVLTARQFASAALCCVGWPGDPDARHDADEMISHDKRVRGLIRILWSKHECRHTVTMEDADLRDIRVVLQERHT